MQGDRKETIPAKKTRPMDTSKLYGELDSGKFVLIRGEVLPKLMGVGNANGLKAKTTAIARTSQPVTAIISLLLWEICLFTLSDI